MKDIDSLKAAIAETNESLSDKAKVLEQKAGDIATATLQAAVDVRNIAKSFSPAHLVQEHPLMVSGAALGLGLLVGNRLYASTKQPAPADLEDKAQPTDEKTAKTKAATPPSPSFELGTIAEPILLGLLAAVTGEVVKKYFPKVEAEAAEIQTRVIATMTDRLVDAIRLT